MPDIYSPCSITFRDARGRTGRVRYTYFYSSAAPANVSNAVAYAATVNGAIEALTVAVPVAATGLAGELLAPFNYGTTGDYQAIEQKAVLKYLIYSAAENTQGFLTINIPAPLKAMFEADGITVKPTYAGIATLTGVLTTPDATGGRVISRTGLPITQFVAGYLSQRKLQRKLTLWQKSANLDEPEE